MAKSPNRKRSSTLPFVQLFNVVKDSVAYHGLSTYARSALIELQRRYNGVNNGFIGLGASELAYELQCSRDRAWKSLQELEDAELITASVLGQWRGRRATEWRLTYYRCDRTGDLPYRLPHRHLHPKVPYSKHEVERILCPSPRTHQSAPTDTKSSQSVPADTRAKKLNGKVRPQSAPADTYRCSTTTTTQQRRQNGHAVCGLAGVNLAGGDSG